MHSSDSSRFLAMSCFLDVYLVQLHSKNRKELELSRAKEAGLEASRWLMKARSVWGDHRLGHFTESSIVLRCNYRAQASSSFDMAVVGPTRTDQQDDRGAPTLCVRTRTVMLLMDASSMTRRRRVELMVWLVPLLERAWSLGAAGIGQRGVAGISAMVSCWVLRLLLTWQAS